MYKRQLEDELRQSICDLAALALAEETNEQEGRGERLRTGVAEQLIGRARRQGCALDESRIQDIIEVDITLNAQGLEVWLARRAKQAEAEQIST